MNLPDQRNDNFIPSPAKRGNMESIEEITNESDALNNLRRTGRTTRLVNEYIERLFKEKTIVVGDHHPSQFATKCMCTILERRMNFELHKNVKIKFIPCSSRFATITLL